MDLTLNGAHEILEGPCPTPFLREIDYPSTGGCRLCLTDRLLNATCCVPCPLTDWTYSEGFIKRTEVANWINLFAIFATAFLLLSFAFLDVKWTHRHYLSICLAVGVFFIELAFIIPLGSKPEQCYNDITPNGMRSELSCAFSGSFLLFGGWATVIWVFWRALSIHLQICWEVVPGPKFFYSALAFGWGIPAAGLATTLSLTGVSYRFGNVCHINHELGLQNFWGPLLAVAALAMVLQFITIGYCIHVFIKSLLKDSPSSGKNGDLPSYTGSFGATSARQTYRRVKRVIQLQWRGASIVLLIIGEVIFFSIVFVSMDNNTQLSEETRKKAEPWVICLAMNLGDKDKCLGEAQNFMISEGVVLAVLVCLAVSTIVSGIFFQLTNRQLSGFWCLLFLGRWSMVLGWKNLMQRKLLKRGDLVSADARRMSNDQRTYEMLDSKKSNPTLNLRTPEPAALSPSTVGGVTPMSPDAKSAGDYFNRLPANKDFGIALSTDSSPLTPRYVQQEWNSRAAQERMTSADMPGKAISTDDAR